MPHIFWLHCLFFFVSSRIEIWQNSLQLRTSSRFLWFSFFYNFKFFIFFACIAGSHKTRTQRKSLRYFFLCGSFCLINIFLFPRFRLIFQLLVFGCKDKKDGGFLAPFSQADLALWRYSACLQTLARSHNRPKPLAIPLPSIVFLFY